MADTTTKKPMLIDIHMHAQPARYLDAINAAGGDPAGFQMPEWSMEGVIRCMEATNTDRAIMSVSAPGVSITGSDEKARDLAHKLNIEMAGYATDPKYASRIGFFGTLPNWTDVDATLQEIDFLFGEQKIAYGVACYTSYQKRLLGDAMFRPIWERLEAYKALVFIHPALLDVEPRFVAQSLPQPLVDYPMATTRTAADLVMTGTLKTYSNVDIVLCHAGGTIPFILQRILALYGNAPFIKNIPVSKEEAAAGFQKFYYDIAISTSEAQLDGLLSSVDPSHVLFGSDHPYCPAAAIEGGYEEYVKYVETSPKGKLIAPEVLRANAERLLAAHEPKRG